MLKVVPRLTLRVRWTCKKAFRASVWSTLWLLPAHGQSLQLSVVCDTQWWGLDSSCPNIYFSIVLPWISDWKDPRVGSICNVMIFCSSEFSSSFSMASLELMEIFLLACYTYGTDGSIMMSYSPMRLPSLSKKLFHICDAHRAWFMKDGVPLAAADPGFLREGYQPKGSTNLLFDQHY